MALYSIKHVTEYRYDFPVSVSHHTVYLQPKTDAEQHCRSFELTTEPHDLDYRSRTDFFGNAMGLFSIQEEHQTLKLTSESEVEVSRVAPEVGAFAQSYQQTLDFLNRSDVPLEVKQYQYASEHIILPAPQIKQEAEVFFEPDKPVVQSCWEMMEWMKSYFTFDAEATDLSTSVKTFYQLKRGVCQDFAHFMLTALTAQGLAARYVSGYILTQPPPGMPRLEGADASHAWVALYVPDYGWLDFDPTNTLLCGDQHVTVAWGRDFGDVSPVRGAINGGGDHELDIAVTMMPIA